jgi:hypothetical protein
MALPRDNANVLNDIRLRYLQTFNDDQSHRIIRPYSEHNGLYQDEDNGFGELLTRLESPPIPINVLEDGDYGWRFSKRTEQQFEPVQEHPMEEHAEIDDDHHLFKELDISIKSKDGTIRRDSSFSGSGKSRSSSASTIKSANHTPSQRKQLITHTSSKYVPSFSKLFGNTSNSSGLDKKKIKKIEDYSDDDDDDDDDDVDDDDEDDDMDVDDDDEDYDVSDNHLQSDELLSQSEDGDSVQRLKDSENNIELDSSSSTRQENRHRDQSAILIDQSYSDTNTGSQLENFNDSKYLYAMNTASSGDDALLLDSDFSDDDQDQEILGDTFNSSDMHILTRSPSSSKPSGAFIPTRGVSGAGRRYSLDSSKGKPKVRAKRSGSLNPKSTSSTVNTAQTPPFELRHTKTFSNKEELLAGTRNTRFEKSQIKPVALSRSKLSEMLKKTKDPLEQFAVVSGDEITNRSEVINLKVFLPNSKEMTLKIRKSSIVFDTIGYILFKVNEKYPEILTEETYKNVNWWCLKLIDDDGEPYEGSFGLLDRTKPISSYGEDEVALFQISELEFNANEAQTPMPKIQEPDTSSVTSSPNKAVPQSSYYKSIIPLIDNNMKDSKMVKVQVYQYPADIHSAAYISFEFLITDNLNEVIQKYAKWKSIDPNEYVLKAVGESFILDLNDQISSLDENYKLEALTKKMARKLELRKKKLLDNNTLPTMNSNLTPQTLENKPLIIENTKFDEQQQHAGFQSANPVNKFSSSSSKHALPSSLRVRNFSRASLHKPDNKYLPDTTLNGQYQKFTVWRRLPMSFINRHERELAIDGDYVYIMPKDEKIWYDTNFKTTTFHISRIKSCKVSKRVSSNFKIVVNKSRGPKRYDFEAINASEASEIINRLKTLVDAYKINMNSGR